MSANRPMGWLIVITLFFFLPGRSYSQPLSGSIQDPLAGSRVFGSKGCAKCHSVAGVGGKIGPDLARISGDRSFNDLAAAMWNHLPQMAAAAQKLGLAAPYLNASEAGDLVGFLFAINYLRSSGNADRGKKLFSDKRCIMCHQIGGVGGVLGPSLDSADSSGSPISVAAAMWNHGPEMTEAMRARGIPRPKLSPAELEDLLAYFKSVAPERIPEALIVLPGRIDEGRLLFKKKQCIQCHSTSGQGGKVAPDLGKRGQHRNVLEFAAALWNKMPAMLAAMKAGNVRVPPLAAEEMADIVAYLRSFQYFADPGSPVRGRQLLSEKRCTTCHALGGGRKLAPDLAQIKGWLSPAAIIAALWNHFRFITKDSPKQESSWSQFSSSEMTHLMAYFERPGRSGD